MLFVAPSAMAQSVDYRASVGCRDAKVDVLDDLTLAQYEQYVRDRRCKCLNICEASVLPNPAPQPVTQPAPQPTSQPASAPRKFKIYEGRDLNGDDYSRANNVSQQACVKACSDDRRCVAFTWDKWNRVCFLKERVPSALRIDPQSISLVLASAGQPKVSSARAAMERFYKAEFKDKGYSEFQSPSFDRCEAACEREEKCEAFSYVKGPKLCKLISKPDEYFRLPSNTVDSGVKRQAAP